MSSNKSVRLASSLGNPQAQRRTRDEMEGGEAQDNSSSQASNNHKRAKRERHRPNEDEIDDIDDWNKDEDDDDQDSAVPSERELLDAKRRRRERRGGSARSSDDDAELTHIDETTSLAAEGVKIEPFNMNQERTDGSGYFEGDTYVFRKRDDDEEPDAWLDSLSDVTKSTGMTEHLLKDDDDDSGRVKSRNTDSRIDAIIRKQTQKADQQSRTGSMDDMSREELYSKILPLVSDTETVTEAVRRYGALIKGRRPKKRITSRGLKGTLKATKEEDVAGNKNSNVELAKTSLDELTGAANALLFKGDVNIYEVTRNDILKILPKQHHEQPAETRKNSQASSGEPVQWEYQGNVDGKIHGPFTTNQMIGWTQAGYFVGAQHVKIRTIRQATLPTKDDLLADLLDSDDEAESAMNQTNGSNLEKGEWMSSNDVDFKAYR